MEDVEEVSIHLTALVAAFSETSSRPSVSLLFRVSSYSLDVPLADC